MAKKKTARKKKPLAKVAAKDYAIVWNRAHTKCQFEHRNGKGGESAMGISDVAMVFSNGKTMCLLSVNYTEGYACVECYADGEGASALCFAEPKDCEKLFGSDLAAVPPKEIAERLLREC